MIGALISAVVLVNQTCFVNQLGVLIFVDVGFLA